MSGKAYTMKEMKGIVEYLTQNKHFKEIKGRKMWMDFANTQLTQRTWQSLKETFLKRILPDIHNPYYKLTMDEIRSFRLGYDVQEREKNKLEIHTNSEDSGSNAENQKGDEECIRKILNEDKTSGENIVSSKVSSRSRASVDTVILDNCYENAEDIQRVLDSPVETYNGDEESTKSPSKSLRDLITYSEPLTPMLQEVLHDFDTDEDSGDDPKMHIVENEPETEDLEGEVRNDPKTKSLRKPEAIEKSSWRLTHPINNSKQISAEKSPTKESESVEKSITVPNSDNTNVDLEEESDKFAQPRIKSLRLRKKQADGNKYVILSDSNKPENVEADTDEIQYSDSKKPTTDNVETSVASPKKTNAAGEDNIKLPGDSVQLSSNSTTDTLLPNNQEALQNSVDNENKKVKMDSQNMTSIVKDQNKITRKRASSQEVSFNLKLKRKTIHKEPIDKRISMSDTDITINKSNTGNVSFPNITDENKKGNVTENNNIIIVPNEINKDSSKINKDETDNVLNASQINPCLQSVSLYAEQLTNDSRHSKTPEQKTEKQPTKADEKTNKTESSKRVIILGSHTESDSNATSLKIERTVAPERKDLMKSQRDKALANVFGFSSGAGTSKRISKGAQRKNSMQHYYRHNSPSDSSSWTSESDSEYVSPPRCRRNRHTKKYLKPKSARIYSLEANGGLFVMYGKKIYPLVRDGKSVKNYLTYNSDSESNEEDNYWKQKYNEVKNKITELEKLIDDKKQQKINEKVFNLPLESHSISTSNDNDLELPDCVAETISAKKPVPVAQMEIKNPPAINKTVKITFAKNNKEVQLEGHWSQLHPVLAEVVDIFHKDTENETDKLVQKRRRTNDAASDKSSVVSIPDDDVHEKVNKIETEIFKEIEKAAETEVESKDETDNNVTKRKRVPSRSRTPSATILTNKTQLTPKASSPKKQKTSNTPETLEPEKPEEKDPEVPQESKIKLSNVSKTSMVSTGNSRTPKKEPKETQSTITRSRKSKSQIQELNKSQDEDDDEIRYMFPPNRANKKSTTSVSQAKRAKQYSVDVPKMFVSPDLSLSDSTQGYLDSDASPPNVWRRKKRKLSTVLNRNHRISDQRSKVSAKSNNAPSSESNSSLNLPEKQSEESTLKSDAYRSESYQLLMQHRRNPFKTLEKIEEDNLVPYDNTNVDQLSTSPNSEEINDIISINLSNIHNENTSSHGNTECGNSSNVSLPLSPELSIVEKLSISKDLLNTMNNPPTLNETQGNETSGEVVDNKYLISQVDVSMPLMQQTCGIHQSLHQNLNFNNGNDIGLKLMESELALKQSNSVNMDEVQTLTESLNMRLTNLLLESAKKMSEDNATEAKKARAKRCSTPRKRKDTKKEKQPMIDPVIEEEHMESCSYGGRQSCPPSIHVIDSKDIENNIKTNTAPKKKTAEKKKKDIIKVKILRPKEKRPNVEKTSKNDKSKAKEQRETKIKSTDRRSIPVVADSGINDSASLLASYLDDSIDLIHNHSETCLHAIECVGDSVEFIETSARSIISLNSNSATSYDSPNEKKIFKELQYVAQEISQGVTKKPYGTEAINKQMCENTSETLYHSPISSELSMNSIITEDLSEENSPQPSQSTKWYLLSEDDTNTNLCPQKNTASFGFGSNLNKLFPITCAVPDLSTITEASKDNDSRKPTSEFLTCDSNTV